MLKEESSKSKPDSEPKRPPSLPRLAITLGDVAGVGPELALRCLLDEDLRQRCQPILVGPLNVLPRIAQTLAKCPGFAALDFVSALDTDSNEWISVGEIDLSSLVPGQWSAETGRASYDSLVFAIDEAMAGRVDAIVTGPIQKEAWHAAGIEFPGHTEVLAERTSTPDVRMMLTSPEISCVLVTIHVPLADVPRLLCVDDIVRTIHLGASAVRGQGSGDVRVTVCGLNPHAGENGLFSHQEEETIIAPAIERARREGLKITGPVPPDTAFTPAMRSRTDVYVCMYHDQGLIPLKAIAFDDAVNVTLGLPIVRTSVDHGTALDIAWKGIASTSSMKAAIDMAIRMTKCR